MKQEGLSGNIRAGFLAAMVLVTGAGCVKDGKLTSPPSLVQDTKSYFLPKHPSCTAVITDSAGAMERLADKRRQITVDVICQPKTPTGQLESSRDIAVELINTLKKSGLPFEQRELAPSAKGNSWGMTITTQPAEAIGVLRKASFMVPKNQY